MRVVLRTLLALVTIVPSLASAQGGQPSIVSVVFNPATVAGGRPASAVITISAPAGNNGFDISLSLSSNVAQLSSSAVTIGSGQTSTTVPVSTTPTATTQLATLSATARGETRTGNLTVVPPTVTSVAVSPAAVNSGQTSTATVTLDGSAPTGGAIVNLSSSNAAATVPATVSIPQGQTSATVTINTGNVTAQTNATIGASVGTTLRNTTLTVLPAPLAITELKFTGVNQRLGTNSGDPITLRVTLNNPAPPGGAIVSYSSTGVNFFSSSFNRDTVEAGSTSSGRFFNLPVTAVDQPFTVTGTLNGVATTITGSLDAPRIFGLSVTPDSVLGGSEFTLRASLSSTPPSTGIPVAFSVSNPAVIIPTSGQVEPGTAMTWRTRTNVVSQETPVTITASFLGSSRTASIRVIPRAGLLSFSASPLLARVDQTITLKVELGKPAPAGGAVVQLSASGVPIGMTIPASITVPAGSTSASITVKTPSRVASSTVVRISAILFASKTVEVRIDPAILE